MPEKKKEEKEESSPLKRHKQEKIEHRNRSPSPPPTMLKAVETAWRARKEKVTSNKDEDAENSLTAYSEYSEDLAPRIFREKNAVEEKKHVDNSIIEDSDRETDYEDEMECTQQLEEEEDDGDMTQSYGGAGVDDEAETEVYPYSDTGTLPYGICSSTLDGVDSEEKNSESKEAAQDSLEKDSVVVPTPDQKSNQRSCEDEVTSREGSQATQQDYLTPRVNPVRVKNLIRLKARGLRAYTAHKTGTEAEPVVEPNSPSQNAKNSDDLLANKPAVGADSQTKAIRSLEFSFSIRHRMASLTSVQVSQVKRIEAFSRCDRPSPFESSISPVYLSTPTPTPTPVDNPTAPEGSITMGETQRKIVSSPQSDTPTGKKKQKTSAKVDSPNQITSTPTAKKRRREFLPPDGNMSSEDDAGDPQTPRPPARRNTRSTQSTPTSTPQVRTRTRTLTPVPSQRAYGSRSRTLFKYKFEFCLTGFVKTGEETLKELIEGHGGKIPERYQDVLYKNNPKAVFMQAVACGIPVVHTDWIKDCIDAGYVVPFDGYQVPTGYSVTTRKLSASPLERYETLLLHIFEGFSFGIVSDVSQVSKSEAKDKANLMAFILKACGADAVYEVNLLFKEVNVHNLSSKSGVSVDVVLCEEYTPTCRYYKRKRHLPVKDFQWVTECMILQKFLNPEEPVFEPHRVGSEDVFAASAEIGDSDHTRLKLYTGELVMADISGSAADHYLLFNVCEILSIHVSGRKDEGSQSKRKDNKESRVMLQVGMLKREPYNPELSKTPVKVLDILSSQVKRRVVAISKEDYSKLKYKDESIFYLEDDSKPDKSDKLAVSEHRWLTQ
ncbi:BRCT domain [Phytophthora cactorum]|nr:BRCT domain [Phytophthora cactorum]